MRMDELLKPVSTTHNKAKKEPLIEISKLETAPQLPLAQAAFSAASTPEEALDILKSEPDHASLISTLSYLNQTTSTFNIRNPGALTSQLIHVLVSETVPNYWTVLAESEVVKRTASKRNAKSKNPSNSDLLLSCLRSVPGLNAILLSIRQQVQSSKDINKQVGGQSIPEILAVLLQVLEALLEGDNAIQNLWEATWNTSEPLPKRKALWDEFLGLLGGKIVGVAAESEDVLNELSKQSAQRHWVADGFLYAPWLTRNIAGWSKSLSVDQEDGWKACSEVLSKSFRLGHTDSIIKELLVSILLQNNCHPSQLLRLLSSLPSFEQRNFLFSLLKITSRDHLSAEITTESNSQWWKSDKDIVAAAAGLIKIVLAEDDTRKSHLTAWLTGSSGAGNGDGIAIRRAVLAALAEDKNDIESILEKSISQFGDQLYIKHVPSMQQDVHAQVILLSAGYLHRKAPLRFSMMMRSGSHLNLVSNRLGASSLRARFLGMVIAEALSGLVDKGDKKMDFKLDEMDTPEAKWYKDLVNVSDAVGPLDPLKSREIVEIPKKSSPKITKPIASAKSKATPTSSSKIIAIEEISDSDEEESSDEDGLQPYAKPDSDAEDSDEDPTLITRNKPTTPVYIRDLILYLRDSENYDKQKLGLFTAAPLIRRKANFGTEVSAHAEELAALLVGIQDKYEIDNFDELRLQGMIAILVAQPLKMGQWFSKTFFDGDYSLSQRASILTTLGLGARELGGFSSESNPLSTDQPTFPSKSLPESMHNRFTPPPTNTSLKAIDNLSTHLQNTYITPLAASIADQQTGPAVFKLQSFTSRLSSTPRPKTKSIPNHIAQTLSTGIFFPLTGRFHTYLSALGSRSSQNIVFQPHLLTHFLKTLSILLHASGPSTLSLPQMTSEYWDLLLSLRTKSIGDVAVLEGILFGFLTIMEVNEEKRGLVDEHGGKMLETQEWVEGVFGRVQGGKGEEERVRMLAAGVLVRIREVVERYQAMLMGDLARFEG